MFVEHLLRINKQKGKEGVDSYCRWFRSLLLCPLLYSWCLLNAINSLCWFFALFQALPLWSAFRTTWSILWSTRWPLTPCGKDPRSFCLDMRWVWKRWSLRFIIPSHGGLWGYSCNCTAAIKFVAVASPRFKRSLRVKKRNKQKPNETKLDCWHFERKWKHPKA